MPMWTDEKADALNIIDSLPRLLGVDTGKPPGWASNYAQWLSVFGINKREPPMTPDNVIAAIAYMRKCVRGEGE